MSNKRCLKLEKLLGSDRYLSLCARMVPSDKITDSVGSVTCKDCKLVLQGLVTDAEATKQALNDAFDEVTQSKI